MENQYKQNQYKHSDMTQKVIRAYYAVYNNLGMGFLEKCYEEALKIELSGTGLSVETQVPITVYYKGQIIGEYRADMIVEKRVLVELKAVKEVHKAHFAQLVNYLRATQIEVGL
jgi:GxxExxY protein